MFRREEVALMGSRLMVLALTVIGVALAVILVDELATGGTPSVLATCVLFSWAALAALVVGMLLRIVGSRALGTKPMPRSRPRRRANRAQGWEPSRRI